MKIGGYWFDVDGVETKRSVAGLTGPNFDRVMRALEEHDRALRQHLALIEGPTALAGHIESALRQQREWDRIAAHLAAIDAASSAQHLALASSTAFNSLLAHIDRHNQIAQLGRGLAQMRAFDERAHFATLATMRLERLFADHLPRQLGPLRTQFDSLAASASTVLDRFGLVPNAVQGLTDWQIEAPTILPYSAAISVAALGRVAQLDDNRVESVEATLDAVGDHVEATLRTVSVALVRPYQGAIVVLRAGTPDWQRHVGASLRTLMDELLKSLAPDAELDRHFPQPELHKEDGGFTRRARLIFIFRHVAIGEYARMAENDIEMTLATFFPANGEVHRLVPTLSDAQGRALLRRVQGCIATILSTIER